MGREGGGRECPVEGESGRWLISSPSGQVGFFLQRTLWTCALMDWGAAGSEPHFHISPRPATLR